MGGGCLQELGPYWSNFVSLAYGICRDLPMFKIFYSCEKSISRTNPIVKFLSLVLSRNVIMLQHLIVKFGSYLSVKWLLIGGLKQKKISNF